VSRKTLKVGVDDRPPLFTVRSALILLLAVLAGGLIAVLTIVAGHPAAEAALAGLGAFAATLVASNQIIG
jgi:hypothetical protein